MVGLWRSFILFFLGGRGASELGLFHLELIHLSLGILGYLGHFVDWANCLACVWLVFFSGIMSIEAFYVKFTDGNLNSR